MKEKEDRRIRYTKALLRDALVELLQTQHISRISVTLLCETADVHRSTFYAHYKDQYDLLQQIQQEVLDNIRHYIGKEINPAEPIPEQQLTRIMEYARQNTELLKVLLDENSGSAIMGEAMQLVREISHAAERTVDDETREYSILFSVSGCISVLKQWLQNGVKEPPDVMARLILRLVNSSQSVLW